MKPLRILISSHEFSPEQGSECAVGWNIVTRLAADHDVTLLCADGPALKPNVYRNAVNRYIHQNGSTPGLIIKYVEQPATTLLYARLNRRLMYITKGFGWQPLYYLGLDHWHRNAYRKAQNLGLEKFDAVHQLTPISFIRPGYLWKSGLPFFWGPLGGMYKVPCDFARLGGSGSFLFEAARNANIARRTRSDEFISIVKKAKRIWTVTEGECRIVNAIASEKASPMIDTSPPSYIVGHVRSYGRRRPLQIVWSGRHEPRKALPLLLSAIANLQEKSEVTLHVLGEGPETAKWKALSRRLGLTCLVWYGQLPYQDALAIMGRADVFVHSSYREAASMVVMEALGLGIPVVCHDTCGMAVAINETCGIKIPFENPIKSIDGFRAALEKILRQHKLVEQMSKGALQRALELSWDAKVREISEAYTKCVA